MRAFARSAPIWFLSLCLVTASAAYTDDAHPQPANVSSRVTAAKQDKVPSGGASRSANRKATKQAKGKRGNASKRAGSDASTYPSVSSVPAPQVVLEAPSAKPLNLIIEKVSLGNGLRVVLNPDHSLPAVGVVVAYGAGARTEEQGEAGFSSLTSDLVNEALAKSAAGEALTRLRLYGGTFAFDLARDLVSFRHRLPANALELGLWVEAERMKRVRVTQDAVQRQLASLQKPGLTDEVTRDESPARVRLEQFVFEGYWPYEHPAFGMTPDVGAASFEGLRAFHRSRYAPNNAVLSISGNFDPDETMRIVHRFFDEIERGPELTTPNHPVLPDQTNQRSSVVEPAPGEWDSFIYGWAIPAARQPDHDALTMAAFLLGHDEEHSRLRARLLRSRKAGAGTSLRVEVDPRRGPSLFAIQAHVSEGGDLDEIRTIVDDEVESLARLGPSSEEMAWLWNTYESSFIEGLQASDQRAARLASLELLHGDARLVHAESQRFLAVRKDDIRKAVGRYLSPTRRTLIEIRSRSRDEPAFRVPSSDPRVPASAPVRSRASMTPGLGGLPSPPIPQARHPYEGVPKAKPYGPSSKGRPKSTSSSPNKGAR